MVATVVELKSSALAVSYYEKDGYYAKDSPEHREASFWQGAAARDAGLGATCCRASSRTCWPAGFRGRTSCSGG